MPLIRRLLKLQSQTVKDTDTFTGTDTVTHAVLPVVLTLAPKRFRIYSKSDKTELYKYYAFIFNHKQAVKLHLSIVIPLFGAPAYHRYQSTAQLSSALINCKYVNIY